ncbi:MAG: histidine kinase [Holophagaceae bacterium]
MPEPAAPWREGLRRRLRSPAYGAAAVLASLPWIWGKHLEAVAIGLPGHPVLYGLRVFAFMPLVFLSYVALAPLPWQVDVRGRGRPSLGKGLAQAVLFCEAWTALLVLGDAAIPAVAGLPADLANTLLYNLQVLGPAAVVVGGLIARLELRDLERREAEARAREVQASADEARARLLQGQLHPHVLFNALNGLTELVRRDPAAAEEGMLALSELLQLILAATGKARFTLADELDILERYLALERMRLGPRLDVEWAWEEGIGSQPVPPLLLQPLVENAVKHGVSRHKQGGRVRIEARTLGDPARLQLRVANTGKPLGRAERPGLGLRNLEERLRLLFDGAATFSLESRPEGTVSSVELPALEARRQAWAD